MATLSNHVALTISVDSLGVARAGFGVPLILSHTAAWAERVRSYTDLSGVAGDFATTSPEYLAAQALFGQTPHPSLIKIGRAANVPTQQYTFTPTAINSTEYKIQVHGEGVTPEEVSYTSDASATVAEITAGLTTALNGVTGKNFTAVDNTTHVTITGDAAGDWFSLELLDPTHGVIVQDHADPGVAADIAAIVVEDDAWYCLLTHFNSNGYVTAAAADMNARKKIYVFDVAENEAITTAVGNSDTLDDMSTAGYGRVAGSYHPRPAAMFSAAWAGRVLPLEPGSATWSLKTLQGPATVDLTATHRTNLTARNANSYESVAGVSITFNGTTSDGDYIDVQRGIDWLEDDMSKRVFESLAGANKIPFTDAGVSVVEADVRASLNEAVRKGILADSPEPVTEVPLVADVSTANKTARNLPDVKFSGTLAGAIHKVTITGVVSV